MNALYRRIVSLGMISVASFLGFLYCLFEFKDKPLYIAGVSVILVVSAYVFLLALLKLKEQREAELRNYIQDTIRASVDKLVEQQGGDKDDTMERLAKATYVQIRKTNSELARMTATQSQSLKSTSREISETMEKAVKILVKYDQTGHDKISDSVSSITSGLTVSLNKLGEEISAVKDSIGGIKVDVPAPVVNVEPPVVNVEPPVVNIPAPVVNVSVPAGAAQPVQTVAAQPEIVSTVEEAVAAVQPAVEAIAEVAEPVVAEEPAEEFIEDTPIDIDLTVPSVSAEEVEQAMAVASFLDEFAPAEEHAKAEEPVAEPATAEVEMPDFTGADGLLSQDFLDAMAAIGEDTGEPEAVEPAPEPVAEPEPVAVTPVSDDPNKQLSPDEIAALFAAAAPKEEPKVEEPVAETPVSDDPNKQLSPDEIAALFAAAAPKEEPKVEEPVAVTPVSDDPNKQLSPDEIAALFAQAAPAPKAEEPAPEPVAEPEPVAVTPVSDDPNKQLSPDEIAALFAQAAPAPKAEKPAPEPDAEEAEEESMDNVIQFPGAAITPPSDDPNKQLSADEIAALFAAASPAPPIRTEAEVAEAKAAEEAARAAEEAAKAAEQAAVAPVNDDPNRQLSPDEIAALFAAAGQ